MSIDGVSSSTPRYDMTDSGVAEETVVRLPEPIHELPIRMELTVQALAPRVTLGTVIADLGEVKHQMNRVESDLESEKIRALVAKDKTLYEAYVKANVTAASLFATAYAFREHGLQMTAVLALVSKFVDLSKTLEPFYDLANADKSARKAAVDAHADVERLGRDVMAAGVSVLKLAADTMQLAP